LRHPRQTCGIRSETFVVGMVVTGVTVVTALGREGGVRAEAAWLAAVLVGSDPMDPRRMTKQAVEAAVAVTIAVAEGGPELRPMARGAALNLTPMRYSPPRCSWIRDLRGPDPRWPDPTWPDPRCRWIPPRWIWKSQMPPRQIPQTWVQRCQIPHRQIPHRQIPHRQILHRQILHRQIPHRPIPRSRSRTTW
jgi:hypothetical protein